MKKLCNQIGVLPLPLEGYGHFIHTKNSQPDMYTLKRDLNFLLYVAKISHCSPMRSQTKITRR